jgi:hypothetical protein
MTQLRAVSTAAALAAVLVLGVPLMILLMLDPASASGCGNVTPTGPGPASVPGSRRTCCRSSKAPASSTGSGTTDGRTSRR